jgi:predicted TIM-barrel fold metal-dependent hydrolase
MIVDCHALFGPGVTWAEPERRVDYDVSALFDRGAQAGIDQHCVLPARNETYETANRNVARLCSNHAGKLTGFAAHSPQREAGKLRRMLADEVKSMGLRGVRSDGHPTRELLDTALELSIPVMYYPNLPAGQTAARWYHMIASAYPKVRFILPHLGQYRSQTWFAHMDALDLVKRYPNVYVDTSGIGSWKYLQMAARELPAERILFGTCAPELDPRVEREAIRLLDLSSEQSAKILGANILGLVGKPAA